MTEPDREGRDDVPSPDPEPSSPLDVDTAFAAIVAGWSDDAGDTPGRWPAQEDLSTSAPEAADARDDDGPDDDSLVTAGSGPVPLVPSLEIEPSQTERDLDEGYVPPEPPPIPRGDTVSRLAWAGVLGGPLFLILAAMFWSEDAPQVLVLTAVAAFVAGFIALVARMPQHHDDDGDDGAVV
jgi:hypothetical protein